ncbi:hypothetical protein M3Y97_01136600 [Aphelenchoides bicaudatus]|nr:hypothetical protein M3Y97_01136600 [Aphelenchoides bicaudatus]
MCSRLLYDNYNRIYGSRLHYISTIYSSMLCFYLILIFIVLMRDRSLYHVVENDILISIAFMLAGVLQIVSLVGEMCKSSRSMFGALVVHFLFLVALPFVELFWIIDAVRYFVWEQPKQVFTEWQFMTIKNFLYFLLFIVVDGVFGFYLPLKRFQALRKDEKKVGIMRIPLEERAVVPRLAF